MNIKDLKRKSLADYKAYTYGEQPNPNEKWIKLNTNENPFSPPNEVVEYIINAVKDSDRFRLYPDPTCKELRNLIVKNILSEFDTLSSPENIMVANGSDEILDTLMKSFVDPGEQVISFKPSYGMYPTLTELYGGKYVEIDLLDNFEIPNPPYNVQGKLFLICSPNNPNGKSVSNEIISEICENFEGIVIADEAYADFSDSTALNLLKKYKNLAVMRTLSKSYSFASQRIGFIIADEDIIDIMTGIKLPYNVSYLSQAAGIAALKYYDLYKNRNDLIKSERNRLVKEISSLDIKVLPTDSNFILLQFNSELIAKTVFEKMKENKILLRTYSKKGMEEYIRVTIGKPEDNDVFLNLLKEILSKTK